MIHALPRWIVLGAFLLALIAGMVNTTAFMLVPQTTVSHMTGNLERCVTTAFLAPQDLPPILMVLGAFFAGAIISGMVIGSNRLVFGKRYGVAMLIESGLLLLSCYGYSGPPSLWGPCFSAMACGLQNAMVSTYSGNAIRTTHLTGVFSDLGAVVGNLLVHRTFVRRHVLLLLEVLGGFLCGATLAMLFLPMLGPRVLLGPALLCLVFGGSYLGIRLYALWKHSQEPIPVIPE